MSNGQKMQDVQAKIGETKKKFHEDMEASRKAWKKLHDDRIELKGKFKKELAELVKQRDEVRESAPKEKAPRKEGKPAKGAKKTKLVKLGQHTVKKVEFETEKDEAEKASAPSQPATA